MPLPCANASCANPAASEAQLRKNNRFGLCRACRNKLTFDCVPTSGFIPSGALRVLSKELKDHLKPTASEIKDCIRFVRGTRHREGAWSDRPAYSHNVVHAHSPRPPMSRRLPQFLCGRRKAPTELSVMTAYVHYWLARHHLGLGHRAAIFLAGASFFQRRALARPIGQRREYQGRIVNNAYHLNFNEFAAIGRHVLRASEKLGLKKPHGDWATTRYLQGVEAGRFHRPIIVPPNAGKTTGAGDQPLDFWLPRSLPHAPQYQRRIRRASGEMHRGGPYPYELDVPLDERPDLVQLRYDQNKVRTTAPPSTDWLFNTPST